MEKKLFEKFDSWEPQTFIYNSPLRSFFFFSLSDSIPCVRPVFYVAEHWTISPEGASSQVDFSLTVTIKSRQPCDTKTGFLGLSLSITWREISRDKKKISHLIIIRTFSYVKWFLLLLAFVRTISYQSWFVYVELYYLQLFLQSLLTIWIHIYDTLTICHM